MRYKHHILKLACSFAVVVTGLGWSHDVSAGVKDTSSQEATCRDIGFRPKTVAFADCVIELVGRGQNAQASRTTPVRSVRSRVAQSPPASVALAPNEQTCAGYGFKRRTVAFSECVMQLDAAQQQAQAQAQQFALQQQQYEQQMAVYQQQVAAQEEERKQARRDRQNQALMRMGLGMMGSQSPTFLGGLNDGLAAAGGYSVSRPPPMAPTAPVFQNYTISTPNGDMVHCTYIAAASYMSCN